jgi:hypothetical protein
MADSEDGSPSRTLTRIEGRVGDRGFWLQTGRVTEVFSCSEADRGGIGGVGGMAQDETKRPIDGSVREGLKRRMGEEGAACGLYPFVRQPNTHTSRGYTEGQLASLRCIT